jgi:hypothetical protein
VAYVLARLEGCVPSLSPADRALLRGRARSRSLAALGRDAHLTPLAVRGRIRRAVSRLVRLADRTGCATVVGSGSDAVPAPAAAGSAGLGDRTAARTGQSAASSSAAAARPVEAAGIHVVPHRPDRRTFAGLVAEVTRPWWVLLPVLVLVLITAAVAADEFRRVLSSGVPRRRSVLPRRWRSRDR